MARENDTISTNITLSQSLPHRCSVKLKGRNIYGPRLSSQLYRRVPFEMTLYT